MNFKVFTIPNFDKEFKRLAKKYHSLKKEYGNLISSLEKNPTQGTKLGNECYKIRFSISSKGKGKSGGARIITHVHVSENSVYLLSIYDKSEIPNISDLEISQLLQDI
ncbi:MAG: type II toxin-antitoxin system RelE/ParE family toxin [Leptospiraceae bacterium]|nr:type II toxin-antitoxin system RelE/ParE family toxin [Leptospiraceae bacterium]MCK6382669.1 type II toxin-antitoxin system RelE/ParE family toxin [Leptospiraceae bacterium]NUM42916.1 type II toxin-antitoxin system RelE/ParE family toxin [Leptospiraceae bacterium]